MYVAEMAIISRSGTSSRLEERRNDTQQVATEKPLGNSCILGLPSYKIDRSTYLSVTMWEEIVLSFSTETSRGRLVFDQH
jgi:hypothetical protein